MPTLPQKTREVWGNPILGSYERAGQPTRVKNRSTGVVIAHGLDKTREGDIQGKGPELTRTGINDEVAPPSRIKPPHEVAPPFPRSWREGGLSPRAHPSVLSSEQSIAILPEPELGKLHLLIQIH